LHPKDPNYQLAVEAARQDRCFCNPGEEKFPPQNRDLSPDSEADSDEPEEIDSLENRQNSMASENGLVKLEYVKAVCPRSKRQLCNRSRPVYPLITGDSRVDYCFAHGMMYGEMVDLHRKGYIPLEKIQIV
jgi:hypothetical protein